MKKISPKLKKNILIIMLTMVLAIIISGAVSAADVDLTVTGTVDTVPNSAVFAKEANNVTIPNIQNNGADTATDVVVSLYASDVNGGTTAVNSTTIASLAGGATTTINLFDPTIRNLEGGSVTYTVKLDQDNLIAETDETNNIASSTEKPVKYNGYKGKRYWEDGSDINTQHAYDLNGDLIYFTQPASAYKSVGWTTRTENWTADNLPIPATGTVQDVWLYLSYNWDTTPGGVPNWTVTLNGQNIDLSGITPYTDKSNFGSWGHYTYGLYVVNVTSLFNKNGDNNLVFTSNTGNSNAIYPSTLAVVYSDPTKTRKLIFLNQECDEIATNPSSYATTLEEATAYANFTGLTIDLTTLSGATLHSFAGSAGPDEGNLLFNGNIIGENAWQGTSKTASALVADVTNYIDSVNIAAIQGTASGGLVALQQFLVLEYGADLIVTDIKANVGAGEVLFANEPNVLSVTVKNNGTVASQATTMDVEVNGTTYTVAVPALEAGASTTVTVTDTASHTGGSSVPINANANPDKNIPETNTSNNTLNINLTVYNNGYKGKQYTDDDEHDSMETKQTWQGQYDLIYSSGDTAYNGAGWTEKTYNWTSSDLVIPSGATVVSARLYQSYTYNKMASDPAWTINFNGVTVTPGATYKDIKGFGSFNYPYGLYVYDVTSLFNTAGNTMIITPETGNDYGIYGAYLIVVYQDPHTSTKKIYINDGFDMLCSRETYSTNDTEATAHANFNDVNTAIVKNGQVIAILASASDDDKSKFFFNGQEYSGFWLNYNTTTQTGFSIYDVTSALINGLNIAGLQSYDLTPGNTTSYGDNLYVLGSILITTFKEDTTAPTVISTDPKNGATKIAAGKTIKVNFSEDIKAGSLWIELKNSSKTAIPFTTSIDGKVLTIDPSSNLAESLYTLILHTKAVTDLAGNPLAAKTTKFSVGTSPTVTTSDPKNGATKVAAGKTIKVTFNENIKKGTMWIELKNSSKKAIPFTASVNGKVLTVNPTGNLAESLYTLILHTGAVTDLAGNPLAAKTTKFSVGTSPTVTTSDPKNGATKVSRSKIIKVVFNEPIKKGNDWIELKNSSGAQITIKKSIGSRVLTITPTTKLKANTKYTLILHTGAVTDKAGNPLAAKTITFTTGST